MRLRKRRTIERLTATGIAICALVTLFVCATSCGSSDSTTPAAPAAPSIVSVTGTLMDWSQNEPFKDWIFGLYDTASTLIYRSAIGEGGRLTISNVPSTHDYYGVLLDKEYHFQGILQFSATVDDEASNFQVFHFKNSGFLGALSIQGKVLTTSHAENLDPVKEYLFNDTNKNGLPDGFDADITNNENLDKKNTTNDLDGDKVVDSKDPDLDNDGIPDAFDADVDNNGIPDIYDTDINHDGISDTRKSFVNYGDTGIKFRYIFHEVATKDDDSTSTNLRFVLESGIKLKSVTALSGKFLDGSTYTNGDSFDGTLYNDGTHGDGSPDDEVWSAVVTLGSGKTFSPEQIVIFKAVTADDKTLEFPYHMTTQLAGTAVVDTCDKEDTNLKIAWTISDGLLKYPGLSIQTSISDVNGGRIYSSSKLPITTTSDLVPYSKLESGKKYFCTVQVLAPSPISGYPSSSLSSKAKSYDAP